MTTVTRASILAAVAAGLLTTGMVRAQEPTWFGQSADGKWMVGFNAGRFDKTTNGFGQETGYGVVLGYEFARPIGFDGSSSLEFLYFGASDGEFTERSDLGVPGTYDADTYSAFFTYRTPGTVYFKGKLGISSADVDLTTSQDRSEERDTALGFGAALGLRASPNFYVELEYTGITGDAEINYISIGAIALF